MERLMGVPLTDYSAIRSVTSRDPEMVLIGALNTWFSSVIGCDTFHADVHAGVSLVGGDSTQAISWLGGSQLSRMVASWSHHTFLCPCIDCRQPAGAARWQGWVH